MGAYGFLFRNRLLVHWPVLGVRGKTIVRRSFVLLEKSKMPTMLKIPAPEAQFGRLVFLQMTTPGPRGRQTGLFQCSCGATLSATLQNIYRGSIKSCGCFRRERARRLAEKRPAFTHGEGYRTKEYRTWHNLKQRCTNPNNHKFPEYGGRGITEAFLADMGRAPSAKHSIDRIENDKGYEPGNCHWATGAQQYANRRKGRGQ